MAVAYTDTQLTFGRTGTDPHQWLDTIKVAPATNEQKLSFLNLYVRTHRDTLHPILLEAVIALRLAVLDEMTKTPLLKGKGPRGRHAPKIVEAVN